LYVDVKRKPAAFKKEWKALEIFTSIFYIYRRIGNMMYNPLYRHIGNMMYNPLLMIYYSISV